MRFAILAFLGLSSLGLAEFPAKFDLRDVSGKNFVSKVKSQSGGTCWTHGTMAAIESNLMITDVWKTSGETGEAALAEYHLDWWNGFNRHFNADASGGAGLTVHEGGDYRVASAYLARGGGAVRDVDGQSFSTAPKEWLSSYKRFYVRDIEWFDAGTNLENIGSIKQALMDHGAMGTALTSSSSFMSSSKNSHYQPPTNSDDPNHAVTIVGWDDDKVTQAPKKGAWLIKNSWGTGFGESGYFWISYYDKISGHHGEMGTVSFQNTEVLAYDQFYFHDYHGWRDTKKDAFEAFNAFTAKGNANGKEMLKSASFYTAVNNVDFAVEIYGTFANGELSDLLSVTEGHQDHTGFHTVDLGWPVYLTAGQKFYVLVRLSQGGQAFDRTSNVPVLLGAKTRVTVPSKANAGESFYRKNGQWVDLTTDDNSANFCIKGLSTNVN